MVLKCFDVFDFLPCRCLLYRNLFNDLMETQNLSMSNAAEFLSSYFHHSRTLSLVDTHVGFLYKA